MSIIKNSLFALVAVMLLGACQETTKKDNLTGSEDTAVLKDRDGDVSTVTTNDMQEQGNSSHAPAAWTWEGVQWEAPIVKYQEVDARDVEVRGNQDYGIYTLKESVLFDSDKATLRPEAKKSLDNIISSIQQRYERAHIGVFGFTDAEGDKDYNKDLSEQRAKAVKDYLAASGRLDADRISVAGYGEQRPKASNATEQGRAENRRVQIVAKK